MPRTVQPSKTRFPHPDYLNAYLFERDGVWHTSVNHKRRTTGLAAKRSNVSKGMEILTERIHEYESGKSGKQVVTEAATTQTALREFLQTKKRVVRGDTLAAYIRVFERYLSKPFLLERTRLCFCKLFVMLEIIRTCRCKLHQFFAIFSKVMQVFYTHFTRENIFSSRPCRVVSHSSDVLRKSDLREGLIGRKIFQVPFPTYFLHMHGANITDNWHSIQVQSPPF